MVRNAGNTHPLTETLTMKKSIKTLAILTMLVAGIFLFAGRAVEGVAYLTSSADVAVDGMTKALPDAVRDRKIEHDLESEWAALNDAKVKIELAGHQIATRTDAVEKLEAATEQRRLLLADAWSVAEQAEASAASKVRFDGKVYELDSFLAELDKELEAQESDVRQLEIKREHLGALITQSEEARALLAVHEEKLAMMEEEFELLKMQREQEQFAKTTYEMLAPNEVRGLNDRSQTVASLDGLRDEVLAMGAQNQVLKDRVKHTVLDKAESNLSRTREQKQKLREIYRSVNGDGPIIEDAEQAADHPVLAPIRENFTEQP